GRGFETVEEERQGEVEIGEGQQGPEAQAARWLWPRPDRTRRDPPPLWWGSRRLSVGGRRLGTVSQLSFFAADAHVPEPADLEGVLAARGQSTLRGGTGQVSVVVDAPWRAEVLTAILGAAGLDPARSAAGPDG